jgi:hypothetical protein
MEIELAGAPVALREDDDIHALRSQCMRASPFPGAPIRGERVSEPPSIGRQRSFPVLLIPRQRALELNQRTSQPISVGSTRSSRPAPTGIKVPGHPFCKELALYRQPRCHGSLALDRWLCIPPFAV